MRKSAGVSERVKTLEVDKADFDRVLKKLIATPPIRKTMIAAKPKPWGRRRSFNPS